MIGRRSTRAGDQPPRRIRPARGPDRRARGATRRDHRQGRAPDPHRDPGVPRDRRSRVRRGRAPARRAPPRRDDAQRPAGPAARARGARLHARRARRAASAASRWRRSCRPSGSTRRSSGTRCWRAREGEAARNKAIEAAGTIIRYINIAAAEAADVYLEAERLLHAQGERVRRDLLEDLLAGRAPAPGSKLTAARAAGLVPATTCVLIAAQPVGAPAGRAPAALGGRRADARGRRGGRAARRRQARGGRRRCDASTGPSRRLSRPSRRPRSSSPARGSRSRSASAPSTTGSIGCRRPTARPSPRSSACARRAASWRCLR